MPQGLGVQKGTALHDLLGGETRTEEVGLLEAGAEDLLSVLGQASGILCLVRGPRHAVAWTSAGFRRLTGSRDIIGQALADIPFDARGDVSRMLDRVRAQGETDTLRQVQVPVQPSPGARSEERFFAFVGQPFLDPQGGVSGILLQGSDVTERVRAEAELRYNSELADHILDLLGDGFVAFDDEFRVIKLNPAALEYDGRHEHEIVGKTHWEAWPTSAGSFLEEAYRRCLREQVPVPVLRRYLGSGKDRWLEIRICPKPGGIVSFYRDVTEHKLAEEALRASEERFRALVEAVPHHVWEAGADGHADWCNKRFVDYTGAAVDHLRAGAWRYVIHPEDHESAAHAWRHAVEHGTVFECEFRLRRDSDRTYRWFLSKGVPLHDADGKVSRWIGTNTDIHDQNVAARELEERNARLEERVVERTRERDRMWHLSTDLMVVAGIDGTIIATNPAWKTLLDWDEKELAGTSIIRLLHPEDWRDNSRSSIRPGGSAIRYDNRVRHRDGSFRWISWTVVPDDNFIHGIGRDITSEREAAEALRHAEEALRQSQKMEAVGQLTGGIAHDFNNLLTGVIGSLDLMRTRIAQGRIEQVPRYIDAAMSSANRAAALTHRLLAFSRRQPLDPEPVDANMLIASMAELLGRTTSETIRVEQRFAKRLWLTHCDSNQLESALLNLVINARDAMPDGGRIAIETRNMALDEPHLAMQHGVAPGQYVALSVADSGSGMSSDVIEKAFEPFFTTKPMGRGTGLGLSMVYGFVKQSGGHVRIQSEPGAGTSVTIYLPRYAGKERPPVRPAAAGAEGRARAGERLLVVEDEPVVRALVVEMLQELGYRVLHAGDGPEGLRILQADEPIDLLLTDVGLPGLNGRQLADAAREMRPDLKILFMTGYVENTLLAKGLLGPGMEVITKPLSFEALVNKLETMLHQA